MTFREVNAWKIDLNKGYLDINSLQATSPWVPVDVNVRVKMQVGLVYLGPIYMGSGANEINVVYDTGSDVSPRLFYKSIESRC